MKSIKTLKLFITIIVSFSSLVNLFAQYNLNNNGFEYSYRNMPSIYVYPEERTYYLDYIATSSIKHIMTSDEVHNRFVLDGWIKQSSPESAAMNISLRSSDLIVNNISAERHEEKYKDKNGVEQITYWYKGLLNYSISLSGKYTFNDNYYTAFSKDIKDTYLSKKTFEHYDDAVKFIYNNKESIINDLITSNIKYLCDGTEFSIGDKYAYNAKYDRAFFKFISAKKNPDYESQQEYKEKLKEVMSNISYKVDLSVAKELSEPIMIYFQLMADKYNQTDKKMRKIYIAMIDNMALLSYLIENYDDAIKYANILIEEEEKSGEKLLKKITKEKEEMQVAHATTRHFPIEDINF